MKKFLFCILLFPVALQAGDVDRMQYIYSELYDTETETVKAGKPETTTDSGLLVKLILVYQKYFSIQDMKVCNFQQSCSNFAKSSLIQYGPFWGSLMASDRLLRDNSFAFHYYPMDPQSELLEDLPPQAHYLPYYLSE